jgi:hypothetical protein
LIQPSLQAVYADRVRERNWEHVLGAVSSVDRVPFLRALWPLVAREQRAKVLGQAISNGDDIRRERAWLIRALRNLMRAGDRVFDGDAAATLFQSLPDTVEVYRGAVEAEYESGQIGLSWTLNPDRARWFAHQHGRFRNLASEPVMLWATIDRGKIAGLLAGRGEDEVLVLPGTCWVECDPFCYEPVDELPQDQTA